MWHKMGLLPHKNINFIDFAGSALKLIRAFAVFS